MKKKFFVLLSAMFLFFSVKSNSALISGFTLILSLMIVSPTLTLLNLTWYVYIMNMLFISGVFVMLLHVASMCTFMMKNISGWWMFIVIFIFPFPVVGMMMSTVSGISSGFSTNNFYFILFIIMYLTTLIMFLSYMMMSSGALRKL